MNKEQIISDNIAKRIDAFIANFFNFLIKDYETEIDSYIIYPFFMKTSPKPISGFYPLLTGNYIRNFIYEIENIPTVKTQDIDILLTRTSDKSICSLKNFRGGMDLIYKELVLFLRNKYLIQDSKHNFSSFYLKIDEHLFDIIPCISDGPQFYRGEEIENSEREIYYIQVNDFIKKFSSSLDMFYYDHLGKKFYDYGCLKTIRDRHLQTIENSQILPAHFCRIWNQKRIINATLDKNAKDFYKRWYSEKSYDDILKYSEKKPNKPIPTYSEYEIFKMEFIP